jgi:hypothetical protein
MVNNNIMKKNNNDHGFGINFTRANKLEEDEDRFMQGLTGTVTLMSSSLIWLIIGSLCLLSGKYWMHLISYICIGVASLLVIVWACIHVIPRVWIKVFKWFK